MINKFPFRHKAFWADCVLDELNNYIQIYKKVVSLLNKANLAEIRNGLDHNREGYRFPSADSMIAGTARVKEAFELADLNRLIPKIFWLKSFRQENYGFEEFEFIDYKGRSFNLYGPKLIYGIPTRSKNDALIIAPGNFLGRANSTVNFALKNESRFSRYWHDYPIKELQEATVDTMNDG